MMFLISVKAGPYREKRWTMCQCSCNLPHEQTLINELWVASRDTRRMVIRGVILEHRNSHSLSERTESAETTFVRTCVDEGDKA